ncbi:ATPase [Neosynechococcus sphagnicola sy1]|uniref:histidine kinase n=2 Tax=Neosynechococcus TaxID=1501143 RepID=A0A098TIJ9_9CYAN|nr:ATPase [Neosynechococcus sphagnicola sy1]
MRRYAPWRQLANLSSLQGRMTLGIAGFFLVGLGSIALWTNWQMQQILIVTHKQQIEYLAGRFPRDVELYSEMLPLEVGLQRTIDSLSTPSLLIWVKQPNGKIVAESAAFKISSTLSMALMSLTEMPIRAELYPVRDRYLVLCGQPLTVRGVALGQVYIAQDVTPDQLRLMAGVRSLILISLLTIGGTTLAIALYIRQSLQPLRQISQLAGAISAKDLGQAKLQLSHAPDEVRELAQTFEHMLSRLSEAWEQQQQFVGNISHELRTPLTIVLGYLQSLLRRSSNFSPTQQEALETAVAETERTVRLLEDLLALARVDSGYMHYHLEPVALNSLIWEIAGMAERFSNRQIEVTASVEDIWITVDRDRLQQVFINLIDNAVKYSHPDQPIGVTLTHTEQQVEIAIGDRGCGIPLNQQSRIFERFYRADAARSRSTGGVGLGLSIVKTLVEGMGGQVRVRSQPDQGSTFTVIFPL